MHATEGTGRLHLTFRDYAHHPFMPRAADANATACHDSRPHDCSSDRPCVDALAPGRWVRSTVPGCADEWCASCAFAATTEGEARRCLRKSWPWIHLTGDSHARNLFDGIAAFLGCPVQEKQDDAVRYDTLNECSLAGARITYLFRGKMMRQRRPRFCRTAEDDLHDAFFNESARLGVWPDALIFSVGSHEAISWGKGPLPTYDLGELQQDTHDFLSWLRDGLGFAGRLVWWKPPYLSTQLGPISAQQVNRNRTVRTFYEQAASLMHEQFVQWRTERPDPALQLADFYQTTVGRRTVAGGHYHDLAPFHYNVLLHLLCHVPAARSGVSTS